LVATTALIDDAAAPGGPIDGSFKPSVMRPIMQPKTNGAPNGLQPFNTSFNVFPG
jgi:hypothetical protein